MSRKRLPNRRLSVVEGMEWGGKPYNVGVGFNVDGEAKEVFLSGAKIGSDAEANIQDACVLMSLLMQHGLAARFIAKQLAREGAGPDDAPASVIAAAAEMVAEIEDRWVHGISAVYQLNGEGEREHGQVEHGGAGASDSGQSGGADRGDAGGAGEAGTGGEAGG